MCLAQAICSSPILSSACELSFVLLHPLPISLTSDVLNHCSWSKSFTSIDFKLRFPMDQVNTARALPTSLLRTHLVGVEVRGHPLFNFGIQGHAVRDMVVERILAAKQKSDALRSAGTSRPMESPSISSGSGPTLVRSGTSDMTAVASVLSNATQVELPSASDVGTSSSGAPIQTASPGAMTPTSSTGSAIPFTMPPDNWVPALVSPRATIDSDSTLFSRRVSTMTPEAVEACVLVQPPAPLIDRAYEANADQTRSDGDDQSAASRGMGIGSRLDPDQVNQIVAQKLAPLSHTIEFVRSHEVPLEKFSIFPRPINLPRDLLRGMKSRHFVCLTIGSRGDVQ